MSQLPISIRPFIGAKDYDLSRGFYRLFGFDEIVLSDSMCLFSKGTVGFYLQKAYVQDWIDNTMIFLEVDDVEAYWSELVSLDLPAKFPGAKLAPIRHADWGSECFVHDPSGILWHIGQFSRK
jgi:hypothetical protein